MFRSPARQLLLLLIKNWWIKKRHIYTRITFEVVVPIIITILVMLIYLRGTIKPAALADGIISSHTGFTSYQECHNRSPFKSSTSLNYTYPSNIYTGPNIQAESCVVGVAFRFDSPQLDLTEINYINDFMRYLDAQINTSIVFFDSISDLESSFHNYSIWAGIIVNSTRRSVSDFSYSIRISSIFLPAKTYPEKDPNIFFTIVANYLAKGTRKFDYSGFSFIQNAVDRAIINLRLSQSFNDDYNTPLINEPNAVSYNQSMMIMKEFSEKIWKSSYSNLQHDIPILVLLSTSLSVLVYLPSVILACYDLVTERTSKMKFYLKTMGMHEHYYQASWFLWVFISVSLPTMIIYLGSVCFGVSAGIAGKSFLLFVLFTLSLCSAVFLLVSISKSTQVVVVFVIIFLGFLPNSLALFLTNSSLGTKAFFSFLSPLAYVFTLVEMIKQETIRKNALKIISDDLLALGNYSITFGYLILVVDTFAYVLIGWYFHNTFTKENPRPYYFLFTKDYWFPDKFVRTEINSSTNEKQQQKEQAIDDLGLEELSSPIEETNQEVKKDERKLVRRPRISGKVSISDVNDPITITTTTITESSSSSTSSTSPTLSPNSNNFEPLKSGLMPKPSLKDGINLRGSFVRRGHNSPLTRRMTLVDSRELVNTSNLESMHESVPNGQSQTASNDGVSGGIGVRLVGVHKVFNASTNHPDNLFSIEGIDLDLPRNQITAIVGEMGSGKSILISLIAGMTTISKGDIEIEGYNIRYDRPIARQLLGLCPQNDMFLEELTVRQHLQIVNRLKFSLKSDYPFSVGLNDPEEESKVSKVLSDLNLDTIENTLVRYLTTTEKKMLSLAVALLADTRVVLLDDPTSGLDPENRMLAWEAIKEHKDGRTILITTPMMEEADAIGDRIGILNHGKLVACGSSSFLKHRFGAGYYLKVTKTPSSDPKKISQFIQDRIQDAKLVSDPFKIKHTMKFTLPFSEQHRYPDLFQDLETQIEAHSSLGVESFAVSLTTLEDVFVKVNQEFDSKIDGSKSHHHKNHDENRNDHNKVNISALNGADVLPSSTKNKPASIWQQLRILLLTKTKIQLRRTGSLFLLFGIPILTIFLVWTASVFGNEHIQLPQILNSSRTSASMEPVNLSFDEFLPLKIPFSDPLAFLPNGSLNEEYQQSDGFGQITFLWDLFYLNGFNLTSKPFASSSLLNKYVWQDYNEEHNYFSIVVNRFNTSTRTFDFGILYNSTESYAIPISQNLIHNSLNAYFMSLYTNYSIEQSLTSIKVVSEPFEPIPDVKMAVGSFDLRLLSSFNMFDQAWTLGLVTCYSILLAVITQELVSERVYKLQFQVRLMGAGLSVYWLATFIMGFARLFLALVLMVVFALVFQFKYLLGIYIAAFLLLSIFFLPAVLWLGFLISRFFGKPKLCFKWILLIYGLFYIIPYIMIRVLQVSRLVVLETQQSQPLYSFLLHYSTALNPFSSFSSGIFELATAQREFHVTGKIPRFSELMSWGKCGSHLCFVILHAVIWPLIFRFVTFYDAKKMSRINAKNIASRINQSSNKRDSLFTNMIGLQLEEAIQAEVNPDLDSSMDEENRRDDKDHQFLDDDVIKERRRIVGGEYETAILKVTGIDKNDIKPSYKSKLGSFLRKLFRRRQNTSFGSIEGQNAFESKDHPRKGCDSDPTIHPTYFAVLPSETFGILGPKGSGKSCLMSILVGEQAPTSGDVAMNGRSIYENQDVFFKNALISYCPPNTDWISNDLTVKEHLELFFSLRNAVNRYELSAMVEYTMAKMELDEYASVLCRELTGTIKRQLCLALALFTGNRLAILDEPTLFMDPHSKRKIWRILKELREEKGLSTVISTQSIAEAEHVCTRYGIFVKGQFQCLGSNNYLRNRFEEGYHLQVVRDQGKEGYQGSSSSESETKTMTPEEDEVDLEEEIGASSQIDDVKRQERNSKQHKRAKQDMFKEFDEFVKDNFSAARILTSYGPQRTYFLGMIDSPAWAFDLLETNKNRFKITDYSLSQTTLVEVYLRFSKNQEINDE